MRNKKYIWLVGTIALVAFFMITYIVFKPVKITPQPAEIQAEDNISIMLNDAYQIESIIKSDVELNLVDMPETKMVMGLSVKASYDVEDFTYVTVFSSKDENVATVDESGRINPVSVGETEIVISSGEISKNVKVTVKEYFIPDAMPETVDILIGESLLLFDKLDTYQVLKAEFVVSDKDIVAIDESGVITTLKQGTTDIVTTTDNSSFTTIINVLQPVEDINVADKAIYAGSTVKANVGIVPENADYGTTLTYSSSDESIATVDEKGIITGKNVGAATITVKTENGIEKSFNVTVKAVVVQTTSTQDSGNNSGGGSSNNNLNPNIDYSKPAPAYGSTSFNNENIDSQYYWEHGELTYTATENGYNYYYVGSGVNVPGWQNYALAAFPYPEGLQPGESVSKHIWVYLGG